jgi:response regulator RpfG family c-di-GMP phosphodiesterase
MPANEPSERDLWAWTVLLCIVLSALDTVTPPQVDFAVLYVGLVVLSLWSQRRSFTYFVAAVSTCLVLRGALVSLSNTDVFVLELWNRLLAIMVIWGAAFLCQLRQLGVAIESRLQVEREAAVKRNEELAASAEMLREKNDQLTATRDVAVYTLAKVAESRDMDTGRHLERITAYSLILAGELRKFPPFSGIIDQEFMTNLRQSSPLHDIGKVSISDAILLKPGALTPDEFEIMRKHALIGSNILQDVISHRSEATFLKMAAVVARSHHERFDGTGYPLGLLGKSIPLPARIVALADVYDALTSERPYKPAYSPERAREMILAQSGKHFDPDIIDVFLRRFDDFLAVQRRYPNEQAEILDLAESLVAACRGLDGSDSGALDGAASRHFTASAELPIAIEPFAASDAPFPSDSSSTPGTASKAAFPTAALKADSSVTWTAQLEVFV